MSAKMPLNILLQLLGPTYFTNNMLVATLYVFLETFLICEMLHTSWLQTQRLNRLQLNCSNTWKLWSHSSYWKSSITEVKKYQ